MDPRSAVEGFLAGGGRAVTFDVFDTLLWRRTLYPADVFALLPYGRVGRALRPLVEAVVTAFCRRVLRREPALRDIYRSYLPYDPQHEVDLEARLTVAHPGCLSLVRDLAARGVPVLAISDMVMSGTQIAALLRAAGYPLLPVLTSADEGVSKRVAGRLFDRALQRLGCSPAGVMHVGDDWHADIAMAHVRGLACVRVQPPRETLLALHPRLAHQRPVGEASLFWGDVALALHAAWERTPQDPAVLKTRLARLLGQPSGQTPPQAFVEALLREEAS